MLKKICLLSILAMATVLLSGAGIWGDADFCVIPAMRGKYAPVPRTGQTTSILPGDDGDLQMGVASPTPRFTNNNNGTVTDKLTGLIWVRDVMASGPVSGLSEALSYASGLHSGVAGLSDGSQTGDWRVPNIREFLSLVDYSKYFPSLPENHQFINASFSGYHISSTQIDNMFNTTIWAFTVMEGMAVKNWSGLNAYVWCVRGGQ
jgi:hypothetical protein